MGQLSFNDLSSGMRTERSFDPRRRVARNSGMGSLGKSQAHWRAVAAAVAKEDAGLMGEIRSFQGKIDASMRKIRAAAAAADEISYNVGPLASQIGDGSAYSMVEKVQSGSADMQDLLSEAESTAQAFEDEYNSKRATGKTFGKEFKPKAEAAAIRIGSIAKRMTRAASQLGSAFARIKSMAGRVQQGQAQASASQEAQYRLEEERAQREAAAEERRYQDSIRREEEQRQREVEARQREEQYRQAALEDERRREEEERGYDVEERQRSADADQRRIDAELRREQMQIEAEQRRIAMEQERILREEDRELRREEREDELRRLMIMQELAAQGVPGALAPVGASALAPMVPPSAVPAPPAPGIQPFVPPGSFFPGMPQPGMPQPGYAATPPPSAAMQPFQQGGMLPAFQQAAPAPVMPGQAAPAGMEWAAFDPASEMFGMGAMVPTANPSLRGAQIEEGYVLSGPDGGGRYTLTRIRDQATISVKSENEMFTGAIVDQAGDEAHQGVRAGSVVYFPPQGGITPNQRAAAAEQATQQALVTGIFGTVQEAIRGASGYLTEQERAKAARRSGRYAPSAPVSQTTASIPKADHA